MPRHIKRRLLTDLLLDRLTTTLETGGADHVAVGDHEAPDGGGWPDEEGVGEFVNYVVLTSLATGEPEGALGAPQESTVFPYALTSIAVGRKDVEHTADRAREAMVGLMRVDTADGLRVQYVNVNSYGAVERIEATEPAFYALSDSLVVFTSQS